MLGPEAARQASWSHRCRVFARVGWVLAALLLRPARAHADVVLAPASDGHLGAFLGAGPVPVEEPFDASAAPPAATSRVSKRLSWVAWTVVDGGTTAFDLGKIYGAGGKRALLAGSLEVPAPLSGWLLLSVDGSVTVTVDGQTVFRRDAPHLRGIAWDPVPLTLAAGTHTLVLDLRRSDRWWAMEARILDAATLEPPRGLGLRLPGASDADATRLVGHLADARSFAGVVPGGFQPAVRVAFPRGAPLDANAAVSALPLSQGNPLGAPLPFGALRGDPTVVPAAEAHLPAASADTRATPKVPDQVKVRIGLVERTLPLRIDPIVATAVTRALALRSRLSGKNAPPVHDAETLIATLTSRVSSLADFENRADASAPARAKRLVAFVDAVEKGSDPLEEKGVLELARRSRLDGEPDAFSLHVPAGFSREAKRTYPLVVVLHGLGGTAERAMSAFLGTESLAPHPRVDGFVLAPAAHGDAFYRGPGETEVLDTLDWVLRTYPIDEHRVSITGHSMGGTGAAHFGLRFPDRFSAAAALAGYHSYFVRRDVIGRALRPWEVTELDRWSPASFAENGRDLFLLVAQGTHDLPLAHSLSLAERYRALGYPLRETYPEIGHDVFRIVWGSAELWPVLAPRHNAPEPRHVTIKTDSLRLGARAWARVTAFDERAAPVELDVTADAKRVVARAKGVDAFELRPKEAGITGATSVEIDGRTFDFAEGSPVAVHRDGATWTSGPLPSTSGPVKRPFVEGPIRDAWTGPIAFVYGTLDDRQTLAAREVAEHFRSRWSGDTHFPLLADVAVPRDLEGTHSLFLVGSKDTNRLVRDLDRRLPLGMDGGAVRAGRLRVTGDAELGFACIYPNPRNLDRYVVVIEAVSARGLFRAMSLPSQLPDFIVFDSGLAPAAGLQVLGDARVLGGGYFDRNWALPSSFGDVLSPVVARDAVHVPPARALEAPRTPAEGGKAPPPSEAGTAPARGPRP